MELKNLISIVAVLGFMCFILFSRNIRRDYLVYVLFLFPLIDLFITPVSMGGFKVFDLITGITMILLIKKVGVNPGGFRKYTVFLVILIAGLGLGCLNSEFPKQSFISLFQFACVLAYSNLLLEEFYDDPHFIGVVISALKLSCIMSIGFLALQLIFGLNVTIYELNPNASKYDGLIRYPSFFQDPQKYGQYLAMLSFLFLIEQPQKKKYVINLGLFIVVIISLFLTGVRAAFTGLCAGLLLVFLFGTVRYKIAGLVCFLVGLFLIVFYGNMFAMFNRGSNVNDTAEVRFAYWQGAMEIFKRNPFLGIGIGNYQQHVKLHAQDQVWEYFGTIEYMDHPESGYLKLLVEFGVICSSIFLYFLIYPLFRGFRSILNPTQNKTVLLLTAAVFSWVVAFVTVYSFSDLRVFILLITLLCLIVASSSPFDKNNSSYEINPE